MRRIKNSEKLRKQALIISLLKSESSTAEQNLQKLFNNNNNNNNTDDDTYDDKIRGKISHINITLNRLGNIITKNDRKKIKKEIFEMENKKNLSDKKKEETCDHLFKLVKIFNKKEKYK